MESSGVAAARKKKIVVVEDDVEVLDLEVFLLESEGYEVIPVRDGNGAVPAIVAHRPDVVLLDLMLPGRDGNAILADLADRALSRPPRVIVVSAYTPRLRTSPLVSRVLAKPFEVSELLRAVAEESRPDERAAVI
jgi:CheY-like chemotaxis protein